MGLRNFNLTLYCIKKLIKEIVQIEKVLEVFYQILYLVYVKNSLIRIN
jgi:hypothetical protein